MAVYIINNPITFYLVERQKIGGSDTVFFEYSSENDTPRRMFSAYRDLFERRKIKTVLLKVPSSFNLTSDKNFLKKIIKVLYFYLNTRHLKCHVSHADEVFGPITSTLFLISGRRKRVLLVHGVGEVVNLSVSGKSRLTTNLILQYLGMPFFHPTSSTQFVSLIQFPERQKFNRSLEDNRDEQLLINFLESPIIYELQRSTLFFSFCPSDALQSPEEVSRFDEFNLTLLLRYCSSDDKVLIKYHPAVYNRFPKFKSRLPALAKEYGLNATVFDELNGELEPGLMPGEAIARCIKPKKVIGVGSMVLLNISAVGNAEVIVDFSDVLSLGNKFLQSWKIFSELNKRLNLRMRICP